MKPIGIFILIFASLSFASPKTKREKNRDNSKVIQALISKLTPENKRRERKPNSNRTKIPFYTPDMFQNNVSTQQFLEDLEPKT